MNERGRTSFADAAADVFYRKITQCQVSPPPFFDVERGPRGAGSQAAIFGQTADMTMESYKLGSCALAANNIINARKNAYRSYVRKMAEKGSIKSIKEYDYWRGARSVKRG